eukprot:CAMPEP_0184368384 /NCGR_PEP_ID=MMETSP1089-20130417/161628_1 /TAXON_ID=38269 ORGANISM="Gloeochaete wittrockiana, Strain SAG46.84" /NCGR_SAMPLE_ID=MMETSP1089 /ASSEMBLY_ACC=CAM_ASM_000445 /LENGTH=260 /DNA_ID=CAMNT_0026710649 /DNA_START=260 /DNA_END=1042 /DNA_ORIENTATION=+
MTEERAETSKNASPEGVAAEREAKKKSSKMTWIAIALFLGVGGFTFSVYKDLKKEAENERSAIKSYGQPMLGGTFDLTDHRGQHITKDSYQGNYCLLYFGFTFCPDVCPAELEKMSEAITLLDSQPDIGPVVQPLFITIDPARDSVQQMAQYVKDFHPRLVGLTGTVGQIRNAASGFRVYFSQGEGSGEGGSDYLLDHSIIMYLLDQNGNFIDYFGKTYTAQTLADIIAKIIRSRRTPESTVDRVVAIVKRKLGISENRT